MFLIKNVSYIDHCPVKLQERIFEKAFKVAEIANLNPDDYKAYVEGLKYYRDLKNVIDTSRSDGYKKGFIQGFQEGFR